MNKYKSLKQNKGYSQSRGFNPLLICIVLDETKSPKADGAASQQLMYIMTIVKAGLKVHKIDG